ncbi:GAP family protein [Actinomadura rugatobispora]|uniref:GAP family protein n=1 Tax=Actinomadura rugatobispora TaxID=1994 RepID=A0ABW1A773_9ACTN|nr:hypothetical protein GCM10010200_078910 [Actinomadura rugatobispora]
MEASTFLLLLALALGLATQPWSILAAVLLSAAKGGTSKATAFVAGWIVALAVVATAGVILLPSRGASASKAASPGHAGADVALGVLLGAVLIWHWRTHRSASTNTVPGWVGRIDKMSPVLALGLGAFLPSYILVAAAVNQLLEAGWKGGGLAGVMVAFVVLASAGVALPLAITLARPDRASGVLKRWREWLIVNRRPITYATSGLFAVLLVIKGVAGLLLS